MAADGFSRFTPRARNVVVESQNAAHAAGNDEIVPAHLLLALFIDQPRSPPTSSPDAASTPTQQPPP